MACRLPVNLARALPRRARGRASSERDRFTVFSNDKMLLSLFNRAAGWLGGFGGRRRGPIAPGVLQSGCRCDGARIQITALVVEKCRKADAQTRHEERMSIVALAVPSCHRTNGANYIPRGRGFLRTLTTPCVRVGEPPPACLRRLQSVERNVARAASARSMRRRSGAAA